ncbi:hypothetical protein [Estrella lausannensis]|uniref:Uncharacterized protein n=1 Tax=Estrella lausannensis TaxID=483423 RepID=A0A0H5DPP1_9BACT|nr:hypothetical protein [Estrella lausannensis]CRX37454.1 hypothetical protein ELAC_0091 [Estrella lausannensis]
MEPNDYSSSGYASRGVPIYPYNQPPMPGYNNQIPVPNPYFMAPPMPMYPGWSNPPLMQWIRPVIGEREEFCRCDDGNWRVCRVPVYGEPCQMPVQVPFPVHRYPPAPLQMPVTDPASAAAIPSAQPVEEKDDAEESEGSDLYLPDDTVGAAADIESPSPALPLSALVQESDETAAFFEESPLELQADDFHGEAPDSILKQFVEVANSGVSVRPGQYYKQWIKKFEQNPRLDSNWLGAMLHDVPPQMVKCLDKIPYIFRIQVGKFGADNPSFLFPCALSKVPAKRKLRAVAKCKSSMCLEVTLDNATRLPFHLFLRPLKSSESIERQYDGKKDEVTNGLYDTNFPSLGAKPVYFTFRSQTYGTEITAIKK